MQVIKGEDKQILTSEEEPESGKVEGGEEDAREDNEEGAPEEPAP